jgi:hypothetical protein
LLLVLDFLLDPLQRSSVGSSAVCFQYLDIPNLVSASLNKLGLCLLVCQGCDLLLGLLIIGEVLLVLLPTRSCGAGHVGRDERCLSRGEDEERDLRVTGTARWIGDRRAVDVMRNGDGMNVDEDVVIALVPGSCTAEPRLHGG